MFIVRFDEALKFASRPHSAQKRKGTEIPCVSRLPAVAAFVIEDGGTEDQAIAALLHDSIEDQGKEYLGGRDGLRREIDRRSVAPDFRSSMPARTMRDSQKKARRLTAPRAGHGNRHTSTASPSWTPPRAVCPARTSTTLAVYCRITGAWVKSCGHARRKREDQLWRRYWPVQAGNQDAAT